MGIGARADEPQQPHRHAEDLDRLDVEGEDAERLAMLERDQDAQRLPAAIDLPPLVLPYPGVEHARRGGRAMDAVPVGREARKLFGRSEKLNRDVPAGVMAGYARDKRGVRHALLHLAKRRFE